MERIVRQSLITFLEENNILTNTLHGFRPRRSCLILLLQLLDWGSKQRLNQSAVDLIYLGFTKAFDKIDYGMIYHNITSYRTFVLSGTWEDDCMIFWKAELIVLTLKRHHNKLYWGYCHLLWFAQIILSVVQWANLTSYADDTYVSQFNAMKFQVSQYCSKVKWKSE